MKKYLASIVVVLLCASIGYASSYPADFLWGAAFSAHQTEGADDGGQNGNWYEFEHQAHSPIKNGDTADVAVDFWNSYEQDLQNAKALGLNTLRTSIAWEKVEPQKGQFNTDVINHYHEIFARMKALGLRPMICLDHFTSPQWFDKEGGWTNDQSPQYFLEYAKFVVSHLMDLTDLWITFNEPMILVEEGYLKGMTPPVKEGLTSGFDSAYNTARAHRMVVAYIHQVQPVDRATISQRGGPIAGVGLAYAFGLFDPADPKNKADIQATENLTELTDWDWLKGVETGHLSFVLHVPGKIDKVFARDLPATDLPANPGPMFDWIGVNYYQRYLIKHKDDVIPFDWITPPGPTSDCGWSIYPEGLERVIRAVAQHFSYPLIVTENGLADGNDSKRPQFIRDHLHYLDNAVLGNGSSSPSIDIRGYYHWSLMDNFEWLSGYSYKFGLFEVDRTNNLKRIARPSAGVYTDEINKRRGHFWDVLRYLE